MKKCILSLCLFTWQFSFAQAPLLSLYEEVPTWNVTNSGKGGTCSRVERIFNYSYQSDTIVSGEKYKIVYTQRRERNYVGTSFFCVEYYNEYKKYLRNTDLQIIEFNISTGVNDTLLKLSGTTLSDSAFFNDSKAFYKILRIDTIEIKGINNSTGSKGVKRRLFQFGKRDYEPGNFHFIDGIGFLTSGPIPSSFPVCYFEYYERLACFRFENMNYQPGIHCDREVTIDFQEYPSGSCLFPLGINMESVQINNSVVYSKELKELYSQEQASEIKVYDLSGNVVISQNEAYKASVKTLNTGLYLAIFTFKNKKLSYKFIVEN